MAPRKKLIASAIAAACAGYDVRLHDSAEFKSVLDQPCHGKRGKKGKAKKDWHK